MQADNFSQSKRGTFLIIMGIDGNYYVSSTFLERQEKKKKKGKVFGNSKSLYLGSIPDPLCVWMEVNTAWYQRDFS